MNSEKFLHSQTKNKTYKMKKIAILLSVIIFTSCGDNKQSISKSTGAPPDTSETIIGYPLGGFLRLQEATVVEKDTIDWMYVDSTNQTKKSIRGKYTYVVLSFPDSTRDSSGRGIKPVLDSLNKPKLRFGTYLVPDSLIYFPKELDIRKIKREHNLK